jgi:hypothetical protein
MVRSKRLSGQDCHLGLRYYVKSDSLLMKMSDLLIKDYCLLKEDGMQYRRSFNFQGRL